MTRSLQGKVAVVVGATSGVGRQTALAFARAGASVVVAARRAGLLHELAEQIAGETQAVTLAIPCDTQKQEDVQSLIDAVRAQFGRIDILIYATGTNTPDRATTRLTPAIWDELVQTNLTGAYYCTQFALPVMREQEDGLFIYISSISAKRGDASGIAYQASKCGIDGLARGTFFEEQKNRIRTSVIYPGLIDTPLMEKRPVKPDPEILAQALQPEDVAQACLFIASMPERCHVPELILTPSRVNA